MSLAISETIIYPIFFSSNLIELIAEHIGGFIPTTVTIQGNTFQEYVKLIDVAKKK